MKANVLKQIRRGRRKAGLRKRIFGTTKRPRLTVYRSLNHIYAQVVDDVAGKTLVSAGSDAIELPTGGNVHAAKEVGKALAQRAKAAGIDQVAFDRNGFRYHGRLKALADAAREGGLKF
ncbi:MAG: 50S ribosomal protein L18 [Phycisphaeraceae bacterium]